jgi:hypothetical protein
MAASLRLVSISPSAMVLLHKMIPAPTGQLSPDREFKADRRKIAENECVWLQRK